MRISMRATLLLTRVLALTTMVAHTVPTWAAPAPPYIRATPATVIVPQNQTQGTTVIEWDAGPAYDDAEVWQRINIVSEIKLSGAPKANRAVTIPLGKKYIFKLYSDAAKSKLLASVEVAASLAGAGTPSGNGAALDDLAARGETLANQDPLAVELRKRETSDSGRRGFHIGMAAAEGHTAPGVGKQKIHDSLPVAERSGLNTAVVFSLERNRNAELAAKGAAIAKAIPLIGKARTADKDVFFWLGFDIATGIFGDPALGALGNTATGPGSLKIRDFLSAAAQRGFNASAKLHLGQDIAPPPGKLDPNSPYEQTGKANNSTGELITQILKEPFISAVQVVPDTRNVIISFASTQSTPPLIEISKVAPRLDRFGKHLVFAADSGAFSRFAVEKKNRYVLDVDVQGEQLDIGSTYHYLINVFNNDRNDTKRPREQVAGKFTTLPQTIKVVWHSILLEDDSDNGDTAEGEFWFWANYGQPSAKYCDYSNDDMDSDHHYYPDKTVVIANAPDHLSLAASGRDNDYVLGTPLKIEGEESSPLNGPQDTQWQSLYDVNAAKGEFDLSKYPGTNVTIPFSLGSMPHGDLRFVIHGRIEITRPTPIEVSSGSQSIDGAAAEKKSR